MTSTGTREQAWLEMAVRLAEANVAEGGGPFAALVMREGEIVGRGTNRVTRESDPTAHAEIMAIRDACRRIGDFRLAGCLLVSSCEPCPMCLGAALWAHVDRVVYAADRDDAAAGGFDDRAFHQLYGRPRAEWDVPVEHLPVERRQGPFLAWQRSASKIPY